MAIKLKARETQIQVGDLKGQYRYILGTELYGKLSESKVIKEAALRSGMSTGVMQAAWDAAGDVIKSWATEGHSVAIPGLGTMRFGVRAKSVAKVEDVAAGIITSRRVIFTPNVEIKDEVRRTAIQITCYDRNGNVVRNVTSADGGNVEVEPEDKPENKPGSDQNPGGSGSDQKPGQSGSGSDQKPGQSGSGSGGGDNDGGDGLE